jgi:hypothetical protein
VTVAASQVTGLRQRSHRNFIASHSDNQRSQCAALGNAEDALEEVTDVVQFFRYPRPSAGRSHRRVLGRLPR